MREMDIAALPGPGREESASSQGAVEEAAAEQPAGDELSAAPSGTRKWARKPRAESRRHLLAAPIAPAAPSAPAASERVSLPPPQPDEARERGQEAAPEEARSRALSREAPESVLPVKLRVKEWEQGRVDGKHARTKVRTPQWLRAASLFKHAQSGASKLGRARFRGRHKSKPAEPGLPTPAPPPERASAPHARASQRASQGRKSRAESTRSAEAVKARSLQPPPTPERQQRQQQVLARQSSRESGTGVMAAPTDRASSSNVLADNARAPAPRGRPETSTQSSTNDGASKASSTSPGKRPSASRERRARAASLARAQRHRSSRQDAQPA